MGNILNLYFEIIPKYEISDYKIDIYDQNDKIISTVDFKKDDNFDSINNINEYLIKNLEKYDSINIINIKKEEIIEKNEIWKQIFDLIEKLWKDEFSLIKEELNRLKCSDEK